MQAASLHSLPLPTRPFSGNLRRFNRRKQRPSTAVSASNRDAYDRDHYNGRIVDENMIVLRMRIRETKMAESNCESSPSEWMEWEKRYCKRYDKDICEAVGRVLPAMADGRYLRMRRCGLA
ncbi:hypothetical protein F0562_032584 [Nyssa sinensis]|uniref:Uncharacterized protein n=1 Tax=Nyssa sinensis TaxID=561372 RepID=A0A5J5APK8_9ASTE|nr:hypothetical protein F0562_032584 [Nyssa sinensis]